MMHQYDYDLPADLIAQCPAETRDGSRALFMTRGREDVEMGTFAQLVDHLRGDECLVVNDTRVIPARLRARRATGGAVEIFLLRSEGSGVWRCWLSPSRRIQPHEKLRVGEEWVRVIDRFGSFWRVELPDDDFPRRAGEVPLPPYIRRAGDDDRVRASDAARYQTLFASTPGAVAAPTAGLHFSERLCEELKHRGVPIVPVTLHVGPGTFKPVTAERIADHRVDPELYRVSSASRSALAQARRNRRRVIAVGTTSLRVLESLENLEDGEAVDGETDLTVLPGHTFRHVDGLITNFHLPRSSLLVLVCAFHGLEPTLGAYRRAVDERCRFYSYGDAMVILPESD